MLMIAPVGAAESGDAAVRARLATMTSQAPDSLDPAPLPGVYEARFGTQIVYISSDGRYMMAGELIDLETGSNLTDLKKNGARKALIDGLDEKSMIVFKAKGKTRHVVTVLTDIDCTYCRLLHQGMDKMNELGIEVRYLGYPRAGVGSGSYRKLVNVWCADDKRQAMTDAKNEKAVQSKPCDNPVASHYKVGQEMGVSGTPALLLSNGKLLPGYLPPDRLLATLNEELENK